MRNSLLISLPHPWRAAALIACASWPAVAQHGNAAASTTAPSSMSALARLLVGVADGRPTGMNGVTRLTGSGSSTDVALGSACRELTRSGPILLDTATRLDGCRGESGKRVVFHLNLVRFDASREGTAAFMASATPALVRGICRNPDVPVLGRLGIALVFRYTGIGDRPVGEIAIAPGRCDQD